MATAEPAVCFFVLLFSDQRAKLRVNKRSNRTGNRVAKCHRGLYAFRRASMDFIAHRLYSASDTQFYRDIKALSSPDWPSFNAIKRYSVSVDK